MPQIDGNLSVNRQKQIDFAIMAYLRHQTSQTTRLDPLSLLHIPGNHPPDNFHQECFERSLKPWKDKLVQKYS